MKFDPATLIGLVLFLLAIGAVASVVLARQRREQRAQFDVPAAPTARTDLRYGYYTCHGDQVAETAGHTNLLWLGPDWEGPEKLVQDAVAAKPGTAIVLDVAPWLFEETRLRPDAAERLRGLFERLRSNSVLDRVRVLVPRDEPNMPNSNVCDALPEATRIMRSVAAEFAQLADVKLGVIYVGGQPKPHVELFDILGFDDYDLGAGIFRPGGMYDELRAQLRPDQRTWIVPGASYGQDPQPFVDFAFVHPEVWAIVPFLWFSPPWDPSFMGLRDLPAELRERYVRAGERVIGA